MARLHHRLVELRRQNGLTQQQLADRAGITRQSLSTLESGRSVPSTTLAFRLAQALDCRVDEAFWLGNSEPAVLAEVAGDAECTARSDHARPRGTAAAVDRMIVASVAGRWVAHRLRPDTAFSYMMAADGVVSLRGGTRATAGEGSLTKVKLLRARDSLCDNLLCAGCAPELGVLCAHARSGAIGARALWLDRPSSTALQMLRCGHTHIAGAHLFDEQSGEFNAPFVRRLLPDRPMLLFNLVRWEAGLVLAPGNPLRLRRVEDLVRRDVSLVPREPGTGAQELLKRELGRAGVPLGGVTMRGPVAAGHMDVARAVALGSADTGVATQSVACAFGLDFLPLAEERFDLVVPKELSTDARAVRLLDTLSSRPFRRELAALGGYRTSDCGRLVATTGPQ